MEPGHSGQPPHCSDQPLTRSHGNRVHGEIQEFSKQGLIHILP